VRLKAIEIRVHRQCSQRIVGASNDWARLVRAESRFAPVLRPEIEGIDGD
jgi:hypothetical protein